MSETYDVIVVGAGHNGLTAGTALQTHFLMAEDLDISPLAAEMIL